MDFVHCIQDFSGQYGLVTSLFLGGLAGGFTHCTAMCSPFVLSQIGARGDVRDTALKRLSGALLIPYHLGRMTTYVFMAAIFHSVLNLAYLFSEQKALLSGPILALAGVLFLVSVFPVFTKMFPWVTRLHVPAPMKFMVGFSNVMMLDPGPIKRYSLGVMLGFMPCGLVLAAIMAASTAPNLAQASLAMAAFSVGTMPALVVTAFGGRALQMKFPEFSRMIRQGAMAVSALWLFVLAGWMMI